jgi:hypothetical protein
LQVLSETSNNAYNRMQLGNHTLGKTYGFQGQLVIDSSYASDSRS